MKRISFSEYDIIRIYEWKLALNQLTGERCCDYCTEIERRIKKFIGEKEARQLQRLVKKYPYKKDEILFQKNKNEKIP
jgi:hypothetical protein